MASRTVRRCFSRSTRAFRSAKLIFDDLHVLRNRKGDDPPIVAMRNRHFGHERRQVGLPARPISEHDACEMLVVSAESQPWWYRYRHSFVHSAPPTVDVL